MSIVKTVAAAQIGENLVTKAPFVNDGGKIDWGVLISNGMSVLFFVAAVACLIFLVWGGIGIILAGGDKSKLDEARRRMIYAAIGMIVVASSYAIWHLVLNFVGIGKIVVPI